MNIFRAMKPDLVLDSIEDINYQDLKQRGINLALLDFDNTLGPDRATEPDEFSFRNVKKLQDEGFEICLVSNAKSTRSAKIAELLNIPCVTYAQKPKPDGVYRALEMMKSDASKAVMVGDQVFTDVMAGKISGCYTIMVEKYQKKEVWYVAIKRPFEKIVRLLGHF